MKKSPVAPFAYNIHISPATLLTAFGAADVREAARRRRHSIEDTARRLRYGFLGEKNGPPARDPEAMRALFDSIRRNVDMRRAPAGPFVLLGLRVPCGIRTRL